MRSRDHTARQSSGAEHGPDTQLDELSGLLRSGDVAEGQQEGGDTHQPGRSLRRKNAILLAPVPRRMFTLTRQKSTLFQWLVVPLWVPTGKDSVPTDSGGIPLTILRSAIVNAVLIAIEGPRLYATAPI